MQEPPGSMIEREITHTVDARTRYLVNGVICDFTFVILEEMGRHVDGHGEISPCSTSSQSATYSKIIYVKQNYANCVIT